MTRASHFFLVPRSHCPTRTWHAILDSRAMCQSRSFTVDSWTAINMLNIIFIKLKYLKMRTVRMCHIIHEIDSKMQLKLSEEVTLQRIEVLAMQMNCNICLFMKLNRAIYNYMRNCCFTFSLGATMKLAFRSKMKT